MSCLLDMSSVLDRADHVKRASLEESGSPRHPTPYELINKKIQNRRGSGSILKILSICVPTGRQVTFTQNLCTIVIAHNVQEQWNVT